MLQQCSYLCNMATDAEHQRCGIAFEMLQAAEDLALIAGEPDIFLHLRYSCSALCEIPATKLAEAQILCQANQYCHAG